MAKAKKAATSIAENPPALSDYQGTKDAPAMTVTHVPIASIIVVAGFNVRKISDKAPDGEGARGPFNAGKESEPVPGGIGSLGTNHASLVADIKRNGLLQPVLVRPVGAAFALVSGHRRFAAVKSLGWKTIPAVVRTMTDREAYLINAAENIQREDLSPGEIAERAMLLREKFPAEYAPGQDGASATLARDLGVSKGYMLNLIRMAEKLHPDIWQVCRSGRNLNAPPHHKIHKWLAMEHDDQWNAYQEWLGVPRNAADATGETPTNADGSPAPAVPAGPTYKRPSKDALETMEQEILARKRAKGISDAEAAVALAVLRYAIGKVGKDGNPPAAPYQAAKSPTVGN